MSSETFAAFSKIHLNTPKSTFMKVVHLRPVRLAYQPPVSSTFLSEQTSHQQPASSTLLSEQTSTSHQPTANRTGCLLRDTTFIYIGISNFGWKLVKNLIV
jgi:hypothetical protein